MINVDQIKTAKGKLHLLLLISYILFLVLEAMIQLRKFFRNSVIYSLRAKKKKEKKSNFELYGLKTFQDSMFRSHNFQTRVKVLCALLAISFFFPSEHFFSIFFNLKIIILRS